MDASPVEKYCLTVENYHRLGEVGILDEDSRVELIDIGKLWHIITANE